MGERTLEKELSQLRDARGRVLVDLMWWRIELADVQRQAAHILGEIDVLEISLKALDGAIDEIVEELEGASDETE